MEGRLVMSFLRGESRQKSSKASTGVFVIPGDCCYNFDRLESTLTINVKLVLKFCFIMRI